ncbi:MAG: DUF58 domain-containing protein [Flavobacteriales bacterium]|nr:DUF58 domain-containing protein [Flavobacteriales bacterium]MCB9192226.1 DUF58 domain-containing protein [Flavobacteriales bacterium]
METSELLKRVRKIEIKTRGLSNQIFSGQYHSAFKGRGMAFSEVREYQMGDDIRTIDWNVTARTGSPYVKVFEEERELTVMLLVDVSGSGDFGSKVMLKRQLMTEICAVLSFSAIQNNDKVGIIFFSDRIEKFIPPKKGKSHILRIIRELIDFTPEHKGTDLSEALRYLTNVVKKRSIAFLLTDFMDKGYTDALKLANKKHDLVAIRIYDQLEQEIPNVGLLPMTDTETGEMIWVDTSKKDVRTKLRAESLRFEAELKDTLVKSGVDMAEIRTDHSYVKPLLNLFKRRGAK